MEKEISDAISVVEEWALANGYDKCDDTKWVRKYSFVTVELCIERGCFDSRYVSLRIKCLFSDGQECHVSESVWVAVNRVGMCFINENIKHICHEWVDLVLFGK